jgi:hypothetical protein
MFSMHCGFFFNSSMKCGNPLKFFIIAMAMVELIPGI